MHLDTFTGLPIVRRLADAGLVRYGFHRTKQLDHLDVPVTQHKILEKLLRKAENTRFGREHGFGGIRTAKQYQAAVPVRDYEAFWQQYWQPVFPSLEGATWPEPIPYYALSSGTTSGTTKYIPISREMLASNRKAAFTTMGLFRSYAPKANIFGGRIFFLGGNTDMRRESNGSRSGDLSAIATIEISSLTRPYTFPPRELSGIAKWEEKVVRLAEAASKLPITSISGVPSWIRVLFSHLKQITGKNRIADIWPKLSLVVTGGTKFDPYREEFTQEVGLHTHFLEVYPCSEGFVATEDPRYKLLRVVPDNDIFFEFVPVSELTEGKIVDPFPVRHTLFDVEVGQQYAVVLTTCAGLWSYLLGDTVVFERRDPPLIRFTGRTKYFLSAFGEHLIEDEIVKAITEAAHLTEGTANEFHVGPIFASDPKKPGHHRYLIEFSRIPNNTSTFIDALDAALSRLNEDYDAHRQGDLTMLRPELVIVRPGGFERWMLAHGKRPPQHKVPKMDNSGQQTLAIEQWLRTHGEIQGSNS